MEFWSLGSDTRTNLFPAILMIQWETLQKAEAFQSYPESLFTILTPARHYRKEYRSYGKLKLSMKYMRRKLRLAQSYLQVSQSVPCGVRYPKWCEALSIWRLRAVFVALIKRGHWIWSRWGALWNLCKNCSNICVSFPVAATHGKAVAWIKLFIIQFRLEHYNSCPIVFLVSENRGQAEQGPVWIK